MKTPAETLCLVRGGGDLATGVIFRLHHAGFPIIVTELENPLVVRRTVSAANAVFEGSIQVEGMHVQLSGTVEEAVAKSKDGIISVFLSQKLPDIAAPVIIDARIAKRNIDTQISDAELVIGMGPGFEAGKDCHLVIETKRGNSLGRVIRKGRALDDTGLPEPVKGYAESRVLRSPSSGQISWNIDIGDLIIKDQLIGKVQHNEIRGPFTGLVRGLIHPSVHVQKGMKIGDIDPRLTYQWNSISDKALSVGSGALKAILSW